MAAVHQTFLSGCCGSAGQCCGTMTGVWYLCLAIFVMVLLICCNDLLKSQCYFIGFPWSQSNLHFIHETVVDEEYQLLLVYNDLDPKEHGSPDMINRPPPPPPYSANDNTQQSH